MRKKYYIFIILIILLLFLMYNIALHKYKEYKISEHTNIISKLNAEIKNSIKKATEIIEYKKSKAYINKIKKRDKLLKNKGEIVVYLTTEDEHNKFIINNKRETINQKVNKKIDEDTYNMTIYQKWIWLLFKEDLR